MNTVYAKCHICGDGGYVVYDEFRGSFICECQSCGALVSDMATGIETARWFEEGRYSNVSECPYCEAETFGLTAIHSIQGPRIECSCGVSGPYGYDDEDALIAWNNLNA
jgi:hypothetical protein